MGIQQKRISIKSIWENDHESSKINFRFALINYKSTKSAKSLMGKVTPDG